MATETKLISGVDFIVIPTEDYERADRFYGDVLGLERSIRYGDMPAREYETGNLTIAVMQSDAFGMEFSPHTHPVEFKVEDLDAARTDLENKGVEFLQEVDSGACLQVFFKDPDGNSLALHHRYKPRAEQL